MWLIFEYKNLLLSTSFFGLLWRSIGFGCNNIRCLQMTQIVGGGISCLEIVHGLTKTWYHFYKYNFLRIIFWAYIFFSVPVSSFSAIRSGTSSTGSWLQNCRYAGGIKFLIFSAFNSFFLVTGIPRAFWWLVGFSIGFFTACLERKSNFS